MFLIEFQYDYYCQGTESAWTTELVYALNYDDACRKIQEVYSSLMGKGKNPRNFKNKTIL